MTQPGLNIETGGLLDVEIPTDRVRPRASGPDPAPAPSRDPLIDPLAGRRWITVLLPALPVLLALGFYGVVSVS